MKRIAVIFEGRLHEQKGVFNAVMQRVKHLREVAQGCEIDVHMIEGYDRGLNRWLHDTRRIDDRPTLASVDGIDIQVHWFCHSLLDTFLHKVLHRPAWIYRLWLSRLAKQLKGYDLISAHDRIAGTAAAMASSRYGLPHFITWHGASIHTDPQRDTVYRQETVNLLQHATCNFFVSKALEQFARQTLSSNFKGEVLYNGTSAAFHCFDDAMRQELRQRHHIDPEMRVVAYVGRMEPVKNVALLPELFDKIRQYSHHPVAFIALGDGSQYWDVRKLNHVHHIDCYMPGGVSHDEMPDWMNLIDVLVLPSRLEGLPLVVLEAIQCGANVVGTDVMGTAEAVGSDNVITPDKRLVERMAHRAVEMFNGKVTQQLPPDMNWPATALREWAVYQPYLTP